MESTGGCKIDNRNDNNYRTWKQKIELLVAFHDLDEVVFEDPPADMEINSEAATLFEEKNAKATVVIGLTLSWTSEIAAECARKTQEMHH
jgi:hypothetical protein